MELKTLKAYIETNLVNSFIRLSKSPASSLILFDRKSDNSLFLCADYQGFNYLTIKNRYPLPLIKESLNRLGRDRWFIQLDLINTYHQRRICKSDEKNTVFRTRYGYFKYQVMSFGLMNTLTSFHGYISMIFAEKFDMFVIVYLDYIFIYTNDDGNGYVKAIWWVLEQLKKFSLYAKLKKCWFHQEKVWFLGYVVSLKGICMKDEKIEAIS